MPDLAEFKALLKGSADEQQRAMKEYVINIAPGLDGDTSNRQDARQENIVFVFQAPNVIQMRRANPGEADSKPIWYLPWFDAGASKATLDGDGPNFFSTSQLDGCRFSIKYDDASRKKVTVLHLSGRLGTGSKPSQARDDLEKQEFGTADLPTGPLARRYSSATLPFINSKMVAKRDKARTDMLDSRSSHFYDGNKAYIWGLRSVGGRWDFFAQDMFHVDGKADEGRGSRKLS